MILTKEGGLAVRDFYTSNSVVIIKKVEKFWRAEQSILDNWIKLRYIRDRNLDDINPNQIVNSAMRKEILANKDTIQYHTTYTDSIKVSNAYI